MDRPSAVTAPLYEIFSSLIEKETVEPCCVIEVIGIPFASSSMLKYLVIIYVTDCENF